MAVGIPEDELFAGVAAEVGGDGVVVAHAVDFATVGRGEVGERRALAGCEIPEPAAVVEQGGFVGAVPVDGLHADVGGDGLSSRRPAIAFVALLTRIEGGGVALVAQGHLGSGEVGAEVGDADFLAVGDVCFALTKVRRCLLRP